MSAIPIPKGAIFTVSSGEYSDYQVHGVFRALEKIDVEKLKKEYLEKHPDEDKAYYFKEEKFLADYAYLMEDVESWELHLGDYGKISRMSVSKYEGEK